MVEGAGTKCLDAWTGCADRLNRLSRDSAASEPRRSKCGSRYAFDKPVDRNVQNIGRSQKREREPPPIASTSSITIPLSPSASLQSASAKQRPHARLAQLRRNPCHGRARPAFHAPRDHRAASAPKGPLPKTTKAKNSQSRALSGRDASKIGSSLGADTRSALRLA
jgi:hypothetical protein